MNRLMAVVTTPQEYQVLQLRRSMSRERVAESMRCRTDHVYSIERRARDKVRAMDKLFAEGFGDD